MRIVTEEEFRSVLRAKLDAADLRHIGAVTGPGRSGAVAAVYASHMLGVPYLPFGAHPPVFLGSVLVVDTARESGRTVRKALKRYAGDFAEAIVAFEEPPRVAFWYEAAKPQRYRHERSAAA